MEELKNDVELDIKSYFDYKIEDADIPKRAVEAINERIVLLLEDIYNLIDIANDDIDNIVEEFSEENLKDIKADLKYQDKKEADLWN